MLLKNIFKEYNSIEIDNYKFKVVHNWDSTLFQNVSDLLMRDKDLETSMILNVKENKKISLRSNGKFFD